MKRFGKVFTAIVLTASMLAASAAGVAFAEGSAGEDQEWYDEELVLPGEEGAWDDSADGDQEWYDEGPGLPEVNPEDEADLGEEADLEDTDGEPQGDEADWLDQEWIDEDPDGEGVPAAEEAEDAEGEIEWFEDVMSIDVPDAKKREFVEYIGSYCMGDHAISGILASVTMAQCILESGWGQSGLAQKAHNLFGIKCGSGKSSWAEFSAWDGVSYYEASTREQTADGSHITIRARFRAYPSWWESILDHSAYLAHSTKNGYLRYPGLVGCTDYKEACRIIQAGGYATSHTYAQDLISLIEKFDLTKYDGGFDEGYDEEIIADPISGEEEIFAIESWEEEFPELPAEEAEEPETTKEETTEEQTTEEETTKKETKEDDSYSSSDRGTEKSGSESLERQTESFQESDRSSGESERIEGVRAETPALPAGPAGPMAPENGSTEEESSREESPAAETSAQETSQEETSAAGAAEDGREESQREEAGSGEEEQPEVNRDTWYRRMFPEILFNV